MDVNIISVHYEFRFAASTPPTGYPLPEQPQRFRPI
jgi:hypothetical protein